jgi:salicylate hydroxylase
VLVVGAGLAGLASAVSAALSGHRVTVVESAKELLEVCHPSYTVKPPVSLLISCVMQVGAGLQVTPNATRILRTWKVSEDLWRSGAEPGSLSVHRYTGKLLAHDEIFGQRMRDDYGHPFVDLHRVDLQLALYERAKGLGVKFVLGQRVEHVDFDGPSIRTGSGLILNADLIVAADGLWSRCRSDYTQSQQLPRPTGDLAYRVVLRLDQIDDPELRTWVENPTVHFWIGPGAHAVGYSLRGGEMYNIVLLVPDDIPDGVGRQAGSATEMRSLFKDWDPILGKFLDLVEDVDKWKLMHSQCRHTLISSLCCATS